MTLLWVAYVLVFVEGACDPLRRWLGIPWHLLPPLMVYAALTAELPAITALAVVGGLLWDAQTGSPLGVSVLPLFTVGTVLHYWRELVLRDQVVAQFTLGLAAGVAVPLGTLLLLVTVGETPRLGWGTLWHLGLVTLGGGLLTPVYFRLMGWLDGLFAYQAGPSSSFRPDREIKRGRF